MKLRAFAEVRTLWCDLWERTFICGMLSFSLPSFPSSFLSFLSGKQSGTYLLWGQHALFHTSPSQYIVGAFKTQTDILWFGEVSHKGHLSLKSSPFGAQFVMTVFTAKTFLLPHAFSASSSSSSFFILNLFWYSRQLLAWSRIFKYWWLKIGL